MNSKVLLGIGAVALCTAVTTPKADAGISFSVSFGVPYIPPPPVVVVAAPRPVPVVVAPAPVCVPAVVVAPHAPMCAPPAVIVRTTPPWGWARGHYEDRGRHGHPVRYEGHGNGRWH